MTQERLLQQIYKKDNKGFTLLYNVYSKSLYGIIKKEVYKVNPLE